MLRKNYLKVMMPTLILFVSASLFFSAFHQSDHNASLRYLKRLYPLAPKQALTLAFFKQLNFYWYDSSATTPFFNQVNQIRSAHAPIKNINTPFVCLAWMRTCKKHGPDHAVVRNLHQTGQRASAPHPFADDQLVEVYHNGYYREPGIYYYVLKGTGVFLNIGHSLVALNKLDALHKLGRSYKEILAISGYAIIYGQYHNSFRMIKDWADQHHVAFEKALISRMQASASGYSYFFNRIADNSGVDYPLYLLARKKGYDTVQLLAQPNDNGGWAFELLDVRMPLSQTLKEKWVAERRYLFTADPFDHHHTKPCHYPIPFDMLHCSGS